MKIVFIKIAIVLVIASSALGMDRPHSMGLVRQIKDNCLVRNCAKCCTTDCCPQATGVLIAEMHLCGCIVNPEFNSKCPATQGTSVLLAGAGALLLSVLGVSNYKSPRRN